MAGDSILSQDAIDILLNTYFEVSEPAVPDARKSAGHSEARADSERNTVNTTPVVVQSKKAEVTLEQMIEISGEAAEAETLPIQMSLSRVTKRVDALEMAIERIADLEQQVAWLRKMV